MKLNSTKNPKATLCVKNTCATVYGETARVVNSIVVVAVVFISVALISKALK